VLVLLDDDDSLLLAPLEIMLELTLVVGEML